MLYNKQTKEYTGPYRTHLEIEAAKRKEGDVFELITWEEYLHRPKPFFSDDKVKEVLARL